MSDLDEGGPAARVARRSIARLKESARSCRRAVSNAPAAIAPEAEVRSAAATVRSAPTAVRTEALPAAAARRRDCATS